MSEQHKPEAWQTSAPGPFLTIETPRGPVALHSLGDDRFRLTGPGVEREITGFAAAEAAADELAEERAMSDHITDPAMEAIAPALTEMRARLKADPSAEDQCAIETAVIKAAADAMQRTVVDVVAQILERNPGMTIDLSASEDLPDR